jgi:Na+-driven multidrug efflux pump
MYIAFITQIVILLSICEAFYLADALTPERIWMAILASHASRLIMTWAVFRTDGWIHRVIELVPPAPLEEEARGV